MDSSSVLLPYVSDVIREPISAFVYRTQTGNDDRDEKSGGVTTLRIVKGDEVDP
jgi:hypothetical protein